MAFDDFRVVHDTLAGNARSTKDRLVPDCGFWTLGLGASASAMFSNVQQERDTMTADNHSALATVQRMFAAFAAHDLDALLETVHPRSRWVYYGANPRLSKAELTGHAEVRSFFERILKRLDMSAFNPQEFVTQGKTVVVFGNESGTVKATGQPFHNGVGAEVRRGGRPDRGDGRVEHPDRDKVSWQRVGALLFFVPTFTPRSRRT